MTSPEGTAGKGSPGGRFRPPPASLWNNMIDAGIDFANRKLSQPGQQRIRPRETDLIKIRNDSGAARRRGEILLIKDTDRPLTDLVDEFIWLKGLEPTADDYFGILKDPAEIGGIEHLQVSGTCIALVNVTDEAHKYANAVAAAYVMDSGDSGPWEILYAPDGTGEKECVVRFAGGGGSAETAWATISESGKDDMYQTVTLYQSAAPDTFTTATCGGVDFEDMQHTLCNSLGSKTVLVPAGYKAGEAFLIKSSMCDHDGDWDGWIVVAGPRMRCAAEYPTEVECCPIEGLKFTAWKTIWFFGGAESTRTDPCTEA